jgi:hypothetical protein
MLVIAFRLCQEPEFKSISNSAESLTPARTLIVLNFEVLEKSKMSVTEAPKEPVGEFGTP